MAASGVGLAMKFFGKMTAQQMKRGTDQTLAEFRDEWNKLPEEWKAQLTGGLASGSLDY